MAVTHQRLNVPARDGNPSVPSEKGTSPSPSSSHPPGFFVSHSMNFRCKVPGRSPDPSRRHSQDVSRVAASHAPHSTRSRGGPRLCAEAPPISAPVPAHLRRGLLLVAQRVSRPPGSWGGNADRRPHPEPPEPASRGEGIPGASGRPRRLTDRRGRLRARPQSAAGMAARRSAPGARAREREGPRAPAAGGPRAGERAGRGGAGRSGRGPAVSLGLSLLRWPSALRVGRSGRAPGQGGDGLHPQTPPAGFALQSGTGVASHLNRNYARGRQSCLGRGCELPAEAGRTGSWEGGARLADWYGVGGHRQTLGGGSGPVSEERQCPLLSVPLSVSPLRTWLLSGELREGGGS